jgi:hypothetical protein
MTGVSFEFEIAQGCVRSQRGGHGNGVNLIVSKIEAVLVSFAKSGDKRIPNRSNPHDAVSINGGQFNQLPTDDARAIFSYYGVSGRIRES